jgi:hypothetical protein
MAGNLTAMIAAAFSGSAAPPVTSDPYFEYTTLLLPGNGTNGAQNNTFLDGSTNNFTITRNGNTTQGTFSPFSQTGWSGSFNTSTTYLTVTDTSNLRFGSSNFTIEAFVYRAASGATQTIASKGASTPTGWVFQISSADKLVFTDTSTSITGATSLAANTWYYVAVVRAGTGSNQTTLYVNAVSDATGTSATTFSQTDNMKIGADRSNTNFANGYISNLRLSNTNRTISSTPTSALAADSNTIFLGLYNNRFQYTDSTAAFTNMTVTGTPSVQAFSSFNPTSSWSAATNGGSGYFDGNGDYLTVSGGLPSGQGTAFTLECWVYVTSLADYRVITRGTVANMFDFGITATGIVSIDNTNTGSICATSAGTITTNQWFHIALTRTTGNIYTIYVNGVSKATSSAYSATHNFLGYMSGFKVSSSLVYSTGFSVPTSPPTNDANTSLLLNFTNAGIYDATSKNDLETVGNAQISTAQYKFSPSSMYFDGTGDYLNISPDRFSSFGTGSFTIEFWMKTSGSNFNIINPATATGTGYWGLLVSTSLGGFRWNDAYNVSNLWTQTATSVLDNNWHHIAIVRNGTGSGNVNIYFDGVAQGTAKTDSTNYNGALTAWRVGSGNLDDFNGYLQDLRITPGIARYTANFTAPTAAFPTL